MQQHAEFGQALFQAFHRVTAVLAFFAGAAQAGLVALGPGDGARLEAIAGQRGFIPENSGKLRQKSAPEDRIIRQLAHELRCKLRGGKLKPCHEVRRVLVAQNAPRGAIEQKTQFVRRAYVLVNIHTFHCLFRPCDRPPRPASRTPLPSPPCLWPVRRFR